MGKFYDNIDQELVDKRDTFLKKIESDMHYTLNRKSDTLSFDWLDEIEEACPFIDSIVRRPKVALVNDERTVEVERAKKITVDSVKDLAKHPDYINDVVDGEVKISKILDVRKEETYDIYENRFLYTLVRDLDTFMYNREKELDDLDLADDKILDYSSTSVCNNEKIDIELRVSSTTVQEEGDSNSLQSLIEKERERIKKVKVYITSWLRSELVKELEKAHVPLINPPVKPTNVILKNPNFQVATKLWEYIRNYGRNDGLIKKEMESEGNQALIGYLDDAFLTSYFVLDSISKRKKEEKEKILKYAILLLSEEVFRTMTLLQANGINITEDELLSALSKLVQKESSNRLVGIEDIKKKFQSEIDEYLKKAKKGL